jgi:superfamily II DNA or RNA helicase
LALLLGARPATGWDPYGAYGPYGQAPYALRLSGPLSQVVVPKLCATGRCRLRASADDPDPPVIAWDDGPAWELWIGVRSAKGHYGVEGVLRRGEECIPTTSALMLTAGGLLFFPGKAARLDHRGGLPWIAEPRRGGALLVPRTQGRELLVEMLQFPERPRLDLPDDLRLEEVREPPRPRLSVAPSQDRWGPARLRCKLSFDYGGAVVSPDTVSWGVLQEQPLRILLRDREAETSAFERLRGVGVRRLGGRADEAARLEMAPKHLPRAVHELTHEGWHVEAEGKLYRPAGAFRVDVRSGLDWFDLEGTVEFGDQVVGLPSILAALKRRETVIALGDGNVGLLPEEWLRRYGLLADFGARVGEVLRFSKSQAGLLDALLAAQPEARVDDVFEQARKRLREFQGVRPADAPPGFKGRLRGYQKEGLGWLLFLQEFGFGGCLADDMGLGKTVQVLALLAARCEMRDAGPSLVVVPRSLVFNWKQEAARFTPRLRVLDHTGLLRTRDASALDAHDVVLTTYGTLRRDALLFKDVEFDYAILDEAQAIKNAGSESAKAARLVRARHRLALSGTPVQNHIGELWSLFEFLNPGMLGRAPALQKGSVGGEARAVLGRALRPFILRRSKEQVATDLPAKAEYTLYCDLEPAQRQLYDELRDHYRRSLLKRIERDGIGKSKIQVLEALLRLRQAACHPGLVDPRRKVDPAAKLEVLLPQVAEVLDEGHKALVFSQFTSFLTLLRMRLDGMGIRYEYLDGRTRDREARVRHFQEDPACGVFLVSLKAGGLGLNLTAAEYVFLLDPWWNPAVEAQAVDRAHRIGQTRAVFAYRLIARNTVEEKIVVLQESKRKLADAIIGADEGLLRSLTQQDLELLLS